MSKEEAIKELEKLASQKYDEKLLNSLHMITEEDETYILTIFERQAIETVLNYIKELEAKIKRYEKYLDNKDKKFKEVLEYEYQERETDYISKQVIRDKIENLKSYKGMVMYEKYNYEAIIRHLEELLESEE